MDERRVVQPIGLQLSSLAQPHVTEVKGPSRGHPVGVVDRRPWCSRLGLARAPTSLRARMLGRLRSPSRRRSARLASRHRALIAANMLAGRVLAPISGIASAITRATQTFTSLRSINRFMLLERERHPTCSYLARQIRHSAGHAGLRSEILVWSGRAGGNAARGYRENKSRRDQGDFQSGLRSSISRRAGLSADNRHA
jgi:hypothetical protein